MTTDEQIRQLRDELAAEVALFLCMSETWLRLLDKALCEADWERLHHWGFVADGTCNDDLADQRRAARARCAEILNARKAAT